MNYLDSSAIVKRFAEERGSEKARRIIEREGPIATSKIAYVEIHSALAWKRREGSLAASVHALLRNHVESDWNSYVRIEMSDEVLSTARNLILRHPLRGFEAIHLASALILKAGLDEQVTFVGADERQLQAAALEGLTPLNVELV